MIRVCECCGSVDVQEVRWVHSNTGEVFDDAPAYVETYCSPCQSRGCKCEGHPEVTVIASSQMTQEQKEELAKCLAGKEERRAAA